MALRKYSTFLLLLFISTSSTNAIPQDTIDKLCGETQDKDFCLKNIGNDPRTRAAADYRGVLLVAISQTTNQVIDASNYINQIRGDITDPVGIKRLSVCDANYKSALPNFQSAWNKANQNASADVVNLVRDGTNAVIDCENIYRRDAPIAQSPLTVNNHNIIKLSEIILIVNSKLMGKQ